MGGSHSTMWREARLMGPIPRYIPPILACTIQYCIQCCTHTTVLPLRLHSSLLSRQIPRESWREEPVTQYPLPQRPKLSPDKHVSGWGAFDLEGGWHFRTGLLRSTLPPSSLSSFFLRTCAEFRSAPPSLKRSSLATSKLASLMGGVSKATASSWLMGGMKDTKLQFEWSGGGENWRVVSG